MRLQGFEENKATKSQQSITGLFSRYAHALEIHLRYQQPVSTVMCPLTGDKWAPSKYIFMNSALWSCAAILGYLLIAVLMTLEIYMLSKFISHVPDAHLASFARALMSCSMLGLYGTLPISLPTIYFSIVSLGLYLSWQKQVPATFCGPTHISISPLSMKLLWKSVLFNSSDSMIGWDEVTSVDLDLPNNDADWPGVSVIVTAQNGKIVHNIPIRLDGFQSEEEVMLFLRSIDSYVATEVKTARFIEWLSNKDKIELLLKTLKEYSVDGLLEPIQELSAPLSNINTQPIAGFIGAGLAEEQPRLPPESIIVSSKAREPLANTESQSLQTANHRTDLMS
jgi:hypothetical protein